jgi:hypothetical protein
MVGNVTSFLGITVSRRTRDDFFKELTADQVQMYQRLLTSNQTGLMAWGNFQRGQELRDQHGGRSSKFLIGMVEAAHRVIPFHHFQWDDCNIIMQYDREQSRPSPFGMRAYKSHDPSSGTFGTDVYMNHANLYVPDCPCFTGDRVRGYEYIMSVQKYVCDMSRAFFRQYKSIGDGVNSNHVVKFNEYCLSEKSKAFFSSVYKFQRQPVLDWNSTANCVTLSFNMGFVGIREDLASGAGSVVLDMLLKFRVLKYIDNGTWQLDANAKTRHLYSYGDQKSNKNCSAFLYNLNNRPLTFEESSVQAEIFLESFNNIMFLPGDWHTGMNMLQTIYKVFWVDILNPMKIMLGWKCISRDIHGCYFQAARLVRNIHKAMSTYLLRCYVSHMYDHIAESSPNREEADVLYSVAVSYCDWILNDIKSTDKHLRLCSHFMTMSGDFFEFVQAYRSQDSVMIESGYSWFAPRWKLLGQSKYLEAYLEQLDCLFKMNKYSRLEEACWN